MPFTVSRDLKVTVGVPAVARWVKDLALSLQWPGFNPWPGVESYGPGVVAAVVWLAAMAWIQPPVW